MKKQFFIMLFASVLFIACDNGATNSSSADAQSSADGTETPTGSTPKTFPNSSGSPQLDKARATLTRNYWICNAFLKIKDAKANRENQGRWYQFKEDGTFTVGQFEDTISDGTWAFNYADSTGQVSLDAKKTEEDGLWNVKFASDESLMIWVGSERFQTNGIQQRLENLLFIPKNRKEMGLKE